MTCKKSCNSCDQKDSTSDSTAQAAGLVHLIDQGSDLFDYYKKGKSEQQGQQGQQGQETKVAEQQADSKTETKKPRRDVEIGWFEKLLSKFQFEWTKSRKAFSCRMQELTLLQRKLAYLENLNKQYSNALHS